MCGPPLLYSLQQVSVFLVVVLVYEVVVTCCELWGFRDLRLSPNGNYVRTRTVHLTHETKCETSALQYSKTYWLCSPNTVHFVLLFLKKPTEKWLIITLRMKTTVPRTYSVCHYSAETRSRRPALSLKRETWWTSMNQQSLMVMRCLILRNTRSAFLHP